MKEPKFVLGLMAIEVTEIVQHPVPSETLNRRKSDDTKKWLGNSKLEIIQELLITPDKELTNSQKNGKRISILLHRN